MTADSRAFLIVVIVALATIVGGIPAYVIGSRRQVSSPGLAFVPFFGAPIVLLRSIGASASVILLWFVPLANVVVAVWFLFAMPARHHRSMLWAVGLLVPVLGLYAYAFTLPAERRARDTGLAGYHIPPTANVGRARR